MKTSIWYAVTVLVMLVIGLQTWAEDDHEHEGEAHEEAEQTSSVGKGKAVLEVDAHENKFKLSADSAKLIKLKAEKLKPTGRELFEVSKSALLEWQDKAAVFRVGDDLWIQFVMVKIESRDPRVVVRSSELRTADLVAVSGVPILRAAQLESSGQGGGGHGH